MKTMTKQDYQTLTGTEVSDKEFERIHEIFMACGGHSKYEFCNAFKKDKMKVFEWVLACNKAITDLYADEAAMYKDSFYEILMALLRLDKDCNNIEAHEAAVKIAGAKEVIRKKINAGYQLRQEEIIYLNGILK